MLLLIGIGASAAVSLISHVTGFQYWRLGEQLGLPAYLNATWFVSLLTVGVAFIAGRGGFAFIIGGFTCYWVLGPILAQRGLLPPAGQFENVHVGLPEFMRVGLFRPVGIGMLVGGAVAGIVLAFPLIVNAIRSMQSAARDK